MKTLQRTLSIVKPDAVERGATGDIIHTLLENKFRIVGMKMLHITKAQAEGFYAVHVHRPFFESLTNFMSSAPVVVMALEKEDAIADYRKLMGATDPAKADDGTIRKKWASSIEKNALHGSDAEDTARFEPSYFFAGYELAKKTVYATLCKRRNPGSPDAQDILRLWRADPRRTYWSPHAAHSDHNAAGPQRRAETQSRQARD